MIESLVIKDLRTIHKKALQKLHKNVGAKVKLVYGNGSVGYVLSTLSDEKTSDMVNDVYVEKDTLAFHILKQNLTEAELPLKGFISVEYNREKYEVLNTNESSTLGNTLVLNCKKVG